MQAFERKTIGDWIIRRTLYHFGSYWINDATYILKILICFRRKIYAEWTHFLSSSDEKGEGKHHPANTEKSQKLICSINLR